MVSKAKMQKVHTKRRASSRHGIALTSCQYNQIVAHIRNVPDPFTIKLTNTRTLHLVEVEGKVLPVVYDKQRKTLATVLPWPYCVFGEIS